MQCSSFYETTRCLALQCMCVAFIGAEMLQMKYLTTCLGPQCEQEETIMKMLVSEL